MRAKDPLASVEMDDHIARGSRGLASQYISTSATYYSVKALLGYKKKGDCFNIHIVKINLDLLKHRNRITDLTNESVRNGLASSSAKSYAYTYDEVLIEGTIPGYAFEVIYSGQRSKCPGMEP